jgi:putative hydrolase
VEEDGLRLAADYHTHTYFSHGRGSIECNVKQAIARGLTRIAITDHGFSQPLMGMTGEKLTHMRRIIDALNKKYAGQIEILLGVEANVVSMNGRIDVPDRYLPMLDVLCVGLHRAVLTTSQGYYWRIKWALNASTVLKGMRKRLTRACTDAMVAAMNRYRIDFITHPGYHYPIQMEVLADAAARTGTAIEINSSHGLPQAEALRVALNRGAMFSLGSDAHRPERVGDFALALSLANEAGIPAGRVINSTESSYILKSRRAAK